MRKVEKYIYAIIVFILFIVIACGITYVIATKNNDKIQDNQKDEKVSLSDTELLQLISYVPTELTIGPDDYLKDSTNVKTIDKELLRNVALNSIVDCLETGCPFEVKKIALKYEIDFSEYEIGEELRGIPLSYVNSVLFKMYNYQLENVKEGQVFNAFGMGYLIQDDCFVPFAGGSSQDSVIHYIEKYDATKDEVVIYDYTAWYSNDEVFYDAYSTYSISVPLSSMGDDYYDDYLPIYLKEHKDKFTKHKHVFKRNSSGYYWYATYII